MSSNRYLVVTIVIGTMVAIGCQACHGDGPTPQIHVIDRSRAGQPDNPLKLIVGVDANGKLTLNEIEVGTIEHPDVLNEKLEAIFEDRRRFLIEESEIRIELTGQVAFDDVSTLISTIREVRPSRITVTTR